MQSITISTGPLTPILRASPARVYVEGRRRRNLQAMQWRIEPAPHLATATLLLHPAASTFIGSALEDMLTLPPVGTSVLIRPAHGDGCELSGILVSHKTELTETGTRKTAQVRHVLATELSQPIQRRVELIDSAVCQIDDLQLLFNAGPGSLACRDAQRIGSRQCRIFDASAEAQPWTVADALAYLLAVAVADDVEIPTPEELAALAGDLRLERTNLTGCNALEALAAVAKTAALDIRSASTGKGLIFYRSASAGPVRPVRLQKAGSSFSPSRSTLWKGSIQQAAAARAMILVLGGYKQYEGTFPLSKGWDASLETARWRDISPTYSDEWAAHADVFRKWVLNEHGWYGSDPWNLPTYDFSQFADDFYLRRPRAFKPCLSSDAAGASLGVVVEVQCGSGQPWKRWPGPAQMSSDECAIYLGGELPPDYFSAAVAGDASVRITAVVSADARVSAQIEGDPAGGKIILEYPQAQWRKVHTSSVLSGVSGLGPPAECDDSPQLEAYAQRHAELVAPAGQADLTLGWVDTAYALGDCIEQIDGRAIDIASRRLVRPGVCAIEHDFVGQCTRLKVRG